MTGETSSRATARKRIPGRYGFPVMAGRSGPWEWRLPARTNPPNFGCMRWRALLAFALLTVSAVAADPSAEAASRAAKAMEAKEYRTAETEFRRAIAAKPAFAEAWVGLGFVLFRQVKKDEATAAFEQALHLHRDRFRARPDDWNQLIQQAFALALLNRDSEAVAVLREGRKRFPDRQEFTMAESQLGVIRKMLTD